MPEPLKHTLSPEVVRAIARDLAQVHPSFSRSHFIDACLDGLDSLELVARVAHIADAMHRYLPRPFSTTAKVLVAALGSEAAKDGSRVETLCYRPFASYVQKYGLEDFEAAMAAQYESTKRFSAEFFIRPFLVRYPERTYTRLLEWAGDKSVHVRKPANGPATVHESAPSRLAVLSFDLATPYCR